MARRTPAPTLRRWLAAAVLIGVAGAASAVQDCELNGAPVNPANGSTTAGKSGLMRCKDRDSGQLQREQELHEGLFLGRVRHYDKGRLAKEHSVNAKGNIEGLARELSASGQVLREAFYIDGQQRGLARSFHPGGQLRRAGFHGETAAGSAERASVEFNERGQLTALRCGEAPVLAPVVDDAKLCGFANPPSQVALFDANGILRSRVVYAAGKRMRNEEFYDNGKPALQDEIAGNLRTERRFSSEGVKRQEIVSLISERGPVRQRAQEFSERGTLVRDQRWNAAGEPLSDDSYYLNGQMRSKAMYTGSGESRTIEIREFHDNGQRATQGRYRAAARGLQVPLGIHQRFDEKGTLRAESSYDGSGRVTRERTWDAKGVAERDDEVFADGSRKAFAPR